MGLTGKFKIAATSAGLGDDQTTQEEYKRHLHEQVRSGNTNFIATNSTSGDKNTKKADEEKKKRDQDYQNILRQQQMQKDLQELNDYIEQLQERAQLLRQEIEQIDTQVAENNRIIEAIEQRHREAQEAFKYFDENGHLERNPDGSLKNKALQELLDAYKARTGNKPESDYAAITYAIEQKKFEETRKNELLTENKKLGVDKADKVKELSDVEKEAKRLIEERDKILNNANSKDQPELIEKLWKSVESRDVLVKAKENDHIKDQVLIDLADNKGVEKINNTLETNNDADLDGLISKSMPKPVGP